VDALKLIPQLFFDLIARVVPGIVALFVFGFLISDCSRSCVVGLNLDFEAIKTIGSALVFFGLTGAAYVVGHLLAPIGKWLRTATQRKVIQEPWRKYDWLRVHRPDAGALAAKIRAEYSMYFSLAAAFFLGAVFCALLPAFSYASKSWLSVGFLIVLGALSLYRGHETVGTFSGSVNHLYEAALSEIPEEKRV
jgi:hypothetical protein